MQDTSFQGQDAQVIAGLYKGREGLRNLDKDDDPELNEFVLMVRPPKEPKGVSRTDLLMYGQAQPKMREAFNSSGHAVGFFKDAERLKRVDSNQDGQLSRKELLEAGAASKDEGERRVLAYMTTNFDDIRGASTVFGSSTISQADMAAYHKGLHETAAGKAVSDVITGLSRTADVQKDSVSRKLYADSEEPLNSITPDAVRQQTVGNCYFEASLASLAQSRPQDIQKMIKDNEDGTYTVTFPGDPDSPVTVSAPTDGELGLYNKGTEHGVWANVMEKAFGQYRKDHSWIDKGNRETPTDGSDGGGLTSEAMNLLTGKSCGLKIVAIRTDSNLQQQIKEALNDSPPRMVCGGTYGDDDTKTLETGYAGNHVYSIIGYREDENGNAFITVRNPWGGEGKAGTSEMSMEDFRKTFIDINVEPRS
jgi:hypothetical protein